MASLLFVLGIFSTFFCAAVNCYTYRIAYPLWRFVGPQEFGALHREYLRKLSPVITLPHVAMFFSTGALLWQRPAFFSVQSAFAVFVLGLLVILLSAGIAGPVHDRFGRQGFVDEPGMRRLLGISAIRMVLMLLSSSILGRAMCHVP